MVHLDRLDFGGDVGRSEGDDHTGLDDTGLDSADGHCADTTDLVDILEGKSEGLVGGSGWWVNGVNGIEKGLSLGGTGLGLLGPSLVPSHAAGVSELLSISNDVGYLLGGLLQHVVSVPSGDGDEGNGLGVVSDLLDETGGLLDDFVVSVTGPLRAREERSSATRHGDHE